jgi:hypothetical protein
MKFVTIKMISEHVGRTKQAVGKALRMAGVKPEKMAGVKGLRLPLKQANDFIARQWPESPSIKPREEA